MSTMSSNLANAENGGMEQSQSDWWLARWSSQFACMGACILFFAGVLTMAFNLVPPSIACQIAGFIQIVAACIVLSIEGSSFVAFLRFARPIGHFFVGKPVWLKTAIYAVITVLPMTVGCGGLTNLGFLVSAGITALHGMLLIGRKAELSQMKQSASQPISP